MPNNDDKKENMESATENSKQDSKIAIPETVRSEVNFLVLPFFALWDKDVNRKTETVYKTTVIRNAGKLEIVWTVSSNPRYGYPGPFDKEVHKAIEQIIGNFPLPIANPIPLGSLYSLCKRMGINRVGGAQYKRIKDALKRIIAATIESEGTFYSKEGKRWINDVFHLYDRVIFKGEELTNGDIAEDNYLFLNSWYLDNINASYIKPVDWSYYRTLGTPIAQRLYELLSVKFYGLLMGSGQFVSYKYSTICQLLPIVRQAYFSNAKNILDPAHKKLEDTNFLSKWYWEKIETKGEDKDWLIKYYPGRRAREEIKRFRAGEQLELELPLRQEEDITKSKIEPSVEVQGIVNQLVKRGITSSVAEKLVNTYPSDRIYTQIEVLDWLKERNDALVENSAGFLRKAIEENYQPPDGYITHLDRQTSRQEVEDRKERWLQHREKLIQQDISKWDTITPKERVQAMLDAWIFIQSSPNQNEIDSMQQELIDNLPKTDEEKREYIARNHPEDPPPDFE